MLFHGISEAKKESEIILGIIGFIGGVLVFLNWYFGWFNRLVVFGWLVVSIGYLGWENQTTYFMKIWT